MSFRPLLGFSAGYAAAQRDMTVWLCETVREWRLLDIYTHEELWAAQALVHELEKRALPLETTER